MPIAPPDIVVITAHPHLEDSRVTRALMRAAAGADRGASPGSDLNASGRRIEVRDLYALYPDFYIDADAERAVLRNAALLVWLQPIHWYGMTPLLKLWLDEVFAFGWAYGPSGRALQGKNLWLVASTGGPQDSYRPDGHNRYFFDAYLHPYEQTAALVGMRWLPPLILHGAHRISNAEIAAHAELFVERLLMWPDWPEIAQMEPAADCNVPADARPPG